VIKTHLRLELVLLDMLEAINGPILYRTVTNINQQVYQLVSIETGP